MRPLVYLLSVFVYVFSVGCLGAASEQRREQKGHTSSGEPAKQAVLVELRGALPMAQDEVIGFPLSVHGDKFTDIDYHRMSSADIRSIGSQMSEKIAASGGSERLTFELIVQSQASLTEVNREVRMLKEALTGIARPDQGLRIIVVSDAIDIK